MLKHKNKFLIFIPERTKPVLPNQWKAIKLSHLQEVFMGFDFYVDFNERPFYIVTFLLVVAFAIKILDTNIKVRRNNIELKRLQRFYMKGLFCSCLHTHIEMLKSL